eukprot:4167427-Pleurochrysis_carterae.AAC.1
MSGLTGTGIWHKSYRKMDSVASSSTNHMPETKYTELLHVRPAARKTQLSLSELVTEVHSVI